MVTAVVLGCVEIDFGRPAVAAMAAWRQRHPRDTEAGGLLLGRWYVSSRIVVVEAVTSPWDGDRRARSRFLRASAHHQSVATAAHAASGGHVSYVGGWHTHPERVPHPSSMDRRDWKRALSEDQHGLPGLAMVIVGTEAFGVWWVTNRRGRVDIEQANIR